MVINIFQNRYFDAVPERQKELDFCRSKNIALANTSQNINYWEIEDRLTYNQMFEITRKFPEQLNVIANSDIYFDEQDLKLAENVFQWAKDKNKLCLALTRWDVLSDGRVEFMNRMDSQDVWMFYGAVPVIEGADFFIGGVAGCDNKIAYLLELSGYRVCNPSIEIKTFHVHNSNVRNYIVNGEVQDRLPPPFCLVPVCSITDSIG